MFISRILFSFLLIFFSHLSYCQDTILWINDYKLNWSDFKAKPDLYSRNMAVTSSGIKYTYQASDTGFSFKAIAFLIQKDLGKRMQ